MHAGIDVSKNWVDVALENGERLTQATPLKAAKWLKKRRATLVVLEATGGYELPMMEALERESIPVARTNPKQIRQFANALGQRVKTDIEDATTLARYAQMVKPPSTILPAKELLMLRALIARRRDLINLRTAERNRRQQAHDTWIIGSIDAMLENLAVQIKTIDGVIKTHLVKHANLDALRQRLCTMPGVGFITAATLIAHMPELGEATRGEIAALAGLAPFTRQSGTWKGKAFCSGGRASVRECLYMAAIAAIRGNNIFAASYQTLIAKGKPPKVALVAVMRKMIVTLNHMNKTQSDFYHKSFLDS